MSNPSIQDGRLTTSAVARRYSVTMRSIDRWAESPTLNFPKPLIINHRKYFSIAELERWECARVGARTKKVA